MMKITYYTVWILALSVLQSTFLDYIKIMGIKPNLFLIFVVCAAMISGKAAEGAVIGFILGFLLDFMTGKTLGINMLLLMYVGLAVGLAFKMFLTGKYFAIIAAVFITSIAYCFLYYTMSFMMWGQGDFVYALINVLLPESLYNTAICVPVYMLAKKTYFHAA